MSEKLRFGNKLGDVVWRNGELISADDANIHLTAHTLHYGLGVFEGIRAYQQPDGRPGIFRCVDHMKRFMASCHTGMLPLKYNLEQLVEACRITVEKSGFKSCYLKPLGFLDAGPMGVSYEPGHPFTVAILTANWGKYLGPDAFEKGARLKISSFTRHHPNISMTKAKICGQYVNSVHSKIEAKRMGFDEAILLDPEGYIAEGSGENLFLIRNGKAFTPSVETVLEGITRDSVCHILKDMNIPLVERRMTRDELYNADEAFLCGTAAEITPVSEVDMRAIGTGRPGKVSQEVHKRYFEIVSGRNDKYRSWITIV